jgi:adenylate cyclase
VGIEIERKFLLADDSWRDSIARSQRLVQGYLTPGRSPSAPDRSPSAAEAMDGQERSAEAKDGRERPSMATDGQERPASSHGACSVRVRIGGDAAWLNIKSAVAGVERAEYEYVIPRADAEQMLERFCAGVVEKIRHHVPHAGRTFEVDEFVGDNVGLIVAELELEAVDAHFERPSWLGREVSDRRRYYNLHLLDHPYARWSAAERNGE